MTVVAAAGVVAPGCSATEPGWIEFEDEHITAVGRGSGRERRPPDAVLDDAILVPGFVDLQVNGVGAIDFAHAGTDGWRAALREQAAHGVTSCCPTLVSAPLPWYAERLAVAAQLLDPETDSGAEALGACVVGLHLEGPFLGGAPGAHVVEHLRPVDLGWLREIVTGLPGLVRIVTLAPEADHGFEAIRFLREAGVVVGLGHSVATYDVACRAADAGAQLVTHCFNGMSPLHHREPGLPGAALDDARLTPSLIADLVHVHPALLRLAANAKRNVVLVTDAVAVGAGTIGDVVMVEHDGAARLADGTLAGSVLTMDQAVRNVVGLGVSLARAAEMAATVPCELLGLRDRGVIEAGRRADVVAVTRKSLAVQAVWIGGRPVEAP